MFSCIAPKCPGGGPPCQGVAIYLLQWQKKNQTVPNCSWKLCNFTPNIITTTANIYLRTIMGTHKFSRVQNNFLCTFLDEARNFSVPRPRSWFWLNNELHFFVLSPFTVTTLKNDVESATPSTGASEKLGFEFCRLWAAGVGCFTHVCTGWFPCLGPHHCVLDRPSFIIFYVLLLSLILGIIWTFQDEEVFTSLF